MSKAAVAMAAAHSIAALRRHLTRKGDLTSAERALLVFLKQEAKTPPKCLLDLCAKMGV